MIEELVVSNCCLTSGKLSKFYAELSECPNIRIVDFSSNKIDPSGVCHLNRIIKTQGEKKNEAVWLHGLRSEVPPPEVYGKGLCELILQDNDIGDAGAEELCHCLSNDGWLQSLNLRKNKIEPEGCIEFVKLLAKNHSLLSLDLRDNPGFNRKLSQTILEKLKQNMETFKKLLVKSRELTAAKEAENMKTDRSSQPEPAAKKQLVIQKKTARISVQDEEGNKLLEDLKESPVTHRKKEAADNALKTKPLQKSSGC